MIISASYRTDIPTFYGDWFIKRLRAGYCKALNPYNRQVIAISLRPEDVDGFVFWTKNVGPFLSHLSEVRQYGFPFVLQHTINGYPRVLEQAVADAVRSVEHLRRIAETFGPRVCVWRYDTIVDSSVTPREFHIETFSRLARQLEGATDEVVVSFAHLYRKTLRNMNRSAEESGFTWSDPTDDWKRTLLAEMVQIARGHKIGVTVCSQPKYLTPGGGEARCVDAKRLADVGGSAFKSKLKGNRPECGCFESRDIGEYDTCPHGCVYCYAVENRDLAMKRYHQHDSESEFLFAPPSGRVELKLR
jgi:hypothetical protein